MRRLFPVLLVAGCGYHEVELSRCFPDCGGSLGPSEDGGVEGEEDLGLAIEVDWATPNTLAIRWPTASIPESVTGYAIELGSIEWGSAQDRRLADRGHGRTVVSELAPDTEYVTIVRGLLSGGSVIVGRATLHTAVDVGRALTIYSEGESPTRTGFQLAGPPATHAGSDALWFTQAGLGGGDGPGLSGMNLGNEAIGDAEESAFLELFIRIDPNGPGLVPFSTRLSAGAGSWSAEVLVPAGGGWHRIQAPLSAHIGEGATRFQIAGHNVTGFGIEASWPAGATIVVDDLRLRY
jgi:hypothetical protein